MNSLTVKGFQTKTVERLTQYGVGYDFVESEGQVPDDIEYHTLERFRARYDYLIVGF